MLAIDMLRPTMVVGICEEQEEPLRPDADASVKQVGQQAWPQHRQAVEDRIGMLKAEALRYVRRQLDRGAFRARDPREMVPGLNSVRRRHGNAKTRRPGIETMPFDADRRTDESRVGKGVVSTGRLRWAPYK